jgi:signal transduction histidine kinase
MTAAEMSELRQRAANGDRDAINGSGLTGLLDRVEAGNGTLNVTSRPGAGTVLRATLPLD